MEGDAIGEEAGGVRGEEHGDGLDDNYDSNTADTSSIASVGLIEVDTDGDTNVDTLEADSDNDFISDTDEAGHGITQAAIDASADTDGDGLKDVVEGANINDGFDVNDENLDGQPAGCPIDRAEGLLEIVLDIIIDDND